MTLLNPDLSQSEDLLYLIGVLKGDGFLFGEYGIRLKTVAKPFVMSFQESLRAMGLNPYFENHERTRVGNTVYEITAHSVKFHKWFKNLNLKEIKNLASTRRYKISFIRGFYESEGTIWKHPRKSPPRRKFVCEKCGHGTWSKFSRKEPQCSKCGTTKVKATNEVLVGPYLQIQLVNTSLETILLTKSILERMGYHPTLINKPREPPRKNQFVLQLAKRKEVYDFLKEIKPVIKNGLKWRG